MIEARSITQTVQGRVVLNELSCFFQKGRMYGVIGPNGVGKSTLLQVLSGVERPKSGDIRLDGRSLSSYPRKHLAKQMAVLQQSGLPPVGFTVREVVSMGRYPFQNWLGSDEKDSDTIINEALTAMGLQELEQRKMDQLSGGERQRVALAKLMAQEPSIILLDEPTTYLDIGFQVQLLDTVRAWQQTRDLTVIAVLHDLNLAALYCDELVVLHQGKVAAAGTPHEVLTPSLIERVYETKTTVISHPVTAAPQIMLQPNLKSES
ncbi:heme ABC transporter ATP-binding protein [Paenibacillus sp. LHD-38]|uniref:heme ABC transporter ATP-binding protein n=1 Tax=Paenibacillus sp. LHD-38 TaxID=3072143 RepID=UPI00280C9341|nr:heme ABC transporter ATP-binding protein [Paenibacillus sp. LHD-38]MDQ8735260.1 heme ABC transporter ATP-binding protein [Paenibacillus sp. LHD-38]